MLRIAMCDDEIDNIRPIAKFIESVIISKNIDAEIVIISDNMNVIADAIKENKVDILFLDIDFRNSNVNGIDFASKLRLINKNFYLVFLTAHHEYPFLAFKQKTFDYIMKPANYEIIADCICRLSNDINSNKKDYVKISHNQIISLKDIIFIEKDAMKAKIYTNSLDYIVYKTLEKFINSLPSNFIRCHKSYIINKDNVKSIDFKNKLIYMINGKKCPFGDKFVHNIQLEEFKI